MATTPRQPRADPGLSPLAVYLRDISPTPLLTAAEEKRLGQRIQAGDAEARDHLIRANLPLVVYLARRYAGKGLGLEDLVAEGNLGLMRAAEKYDPRLDLRFSTYAAYWVRQGLRRALLRDSRPARVPSHVAALVARWRRVAARLGEELGHAPDEQEVARRLGLSARHQELARQALHWSEGAGRREATDLAALPDRRAGRPGAGLEQAEDLRRALTLFESLDPREAQVLRLHFGLGGGRPVTLRELGERLGLTREGVRQLEKKALRKLAGLMGAG